MKAMYTAPIPAQTLTGGVIRAVPGIGWSARLERPVLSSSLP